MAEDTAIIVNESALPDQIMAALRQLLLLAGGWAAGAGYLRADSVESIVGAALVLFSFFYGQWKTRQRAQQLATVAGNTRVPAKIARLKAKI